VRLQQGSRSGVVSAVPRWRIVAGAGILAALVGLLTLLAPAYFHDLDLQSYVSGLTRDEAGRATSDGALREEIVDKAKQLDLPVSADNVRITRAADGKLEHIDVRYFVDVNLPGYTVKLHFYPGAASQ
jgi:membrane protein required for beta-lactamase induction